MEENNALNIHSEKLRQGYRERVQKHNEARKTQKENVIEPELVEDDDSPQVAGEAISAMYIQCS